MADMFPLQFSHRKTNFKLIVPLIILVLNYLPAMANGAENTHVFANAFMWIVIALVAARIGGIVEKKGQPAVLGELLMGVVLGNIWLAGINFFEPMKKDIFLHFLSELGVVILLFQVGLESNLEQMRKVGLRAFLVAVIGVVLPFLLGFYIAGPYLLPGHNTNVYLFLGATLTATSVGITARVFKDLNVLNSKEARIVLGAAVIDDVLGLIILAIVSGIVKTGTISLAGIAQTIALALAFLAGGLFIGIYAAKIIGRWLSRINPGAAMKLAFAVGTGLSFAWLADLTGLAPIVGAFTAGVMLDAVHFRHFDDPHFAAEIQQAAIDAPEQVKNRIIQVADHYAEKHVEHILEPIGHFTAPVFFIMTGMAVDITTMFSLNIVLTALGITALAFAGKLMAGFAGGKGTRKALIGWGMVPRGEVGLIFASVGRTLNVVDNTEYSIIVIVVILSTLITPPVLSRLLIKNAGT
jgi:Kef-type K+ transport system membrane component KefB